MKKIFIIMLIFAVMSVSCSNRFVIKNDSTEEINTDHSERFYTYVLVKSNSMYHDERCSILHKYTDSEKTTSKDIDFIKKCGYTPCKICLPYM